MNSSRQTKQKSVIAEVFEQSGRPMTPQEVFIQAQRQVPLLSIATVYRVIRGLVTERALVPVAVPGEPDRYETQHRAAHHHHHFQCSACLRVFDIPGCGLRVDTQLPDGFVLRRHEVMLYGSCNECAR